MTINPSVRLYGPDDTPLDVLNGVAVPAATTGLIPMVVDSGGIARRTRGDAFGRPQTDLDRWFGSAAPTVGPKLKIDSIPVTMATDQDPIGVYIIGPPDTTTRGIAIGKVLPGGAASNNKFAIRRTTYNEQTAGAQRSVVSTSASDSAAGAGARQVKITYFDFALLVELTETITLNGVTPVNTGATDLCFIEKMEVVSVGSTGGNVGTITLKTGVGGAGTDIGSIAFSTPGSNNLNGINNRTYWAHHYVAVGLTCTIVTFDAGTQGNQNAESFLSSVNPLVATSPDVQISDSITVGLNSATTPRPVPNTIRIPGPARITQYVIPAGNNTAFYGSFDFLET
jgi:hypothetical protein